MLSGPHGATLRRGVLSALAVAVTIAAPAAAQGPSVSLERFTPSETPEDDFQLSRPTDFGHLRLGAQLHLSYALDPLVYESDLGDAGTETVSVVAAELVGTVGLSLGLFDRVVVFAGLPVVLAMSGAPADEVQPLGAAAADGGGLGDVVLGGRVRLLGEAGDVGALALQLTLSVPTASYEAQSYRGEDHVTFLPELLGELRPLDGLRLVLNAGVRLREEDPPRETNFELRHELTFGLGVVGELYRDGEDPRRHLDLHLQTYGATALAFAFEREQLSLEVIGGLEYFHESGIVLGAAGGLGLSRGFGTPDLRVVATVGWSSPTEPEDGDGDGVSDALDACPAESEDADGFQDEDGCPDLDDDADGVLDADDACPREPETTNAFEDGDGCPDGVPGDGDGDGVRDDRDACPTEPEDRDAHEDGDGCPDPDNDGDGVVDEVDGCPEDPGPVVNRGCPDADRDGDTVVDRMDNCPEEPGTVENHGCANPQQVVLEGGRLVILDRVYFRTNRAEIQRRSFPLLRNVAEVLNAHPELTEVDVEGHTDSRGRHAANVRLSQRRAESVVTFLVDAGVERGRLTPRGYGPDRPLVPDAQTAEDHARNRRVEFNLGEDSGIETRD